MLKLETDQTTEFFSENKLFVIKKRFKVFSFCFDELPIIVF